MGSQRDGRISIEQMSQGKRKDDPDEDSGVCLEQTDGDVFDFMFFVIFGCECFWSGIPDGISK